MYDIDIIRVTLNAKSRFTKIENANYAVNIAKALSLSVVNVGGTDIVDGNKKMVLALTFQLMRK
jgi:plastin-1